LLENPLTRVIMGECRVLRQFVFRRYNRRYSSSLGHQKRIQWTVHSLSRAPFLCTTVHHSLCKFFHHRTKYPSYIDALCVRHDAYTRCHFLSKLLDTHGDADFVETTPRQCSYPHSRKLRNAHALRLALIGRSHLDLHTIRFSCASQSNVVSVHSILLVS
jgi:hypothetical protein